MAVYYLHKAVDDAVYWLENTAIRLFVKGINWQMWIWCLHLELLWKLIALLICIYVKSPPQWNLVGNQLFSITQSNRTITRKSLSV